jgi:hypothetical protein
MKSLFGFANYLKNHIFLYTNIVAPLEVLQKKKWITPQDWSEEYERAFTQLKQVIVTALILKALL